MKQTPIELRTLGVLMNWAGYFSTLILFLFLTSGCSVGSTSMPVAPNGTPDLPSSEVPRNPEVPNPNQEPVIVSTPMPISSIAAQSIADADKSSDSTDDTYASDATHSTDASEQVDTSANQEPARISQTRTPARQAPQAGRTSIPKPQAKTRKQSGDRYGDQPSNPYHPPSRNIDNSKESADFDDNSPDSIAPEPIRINKEPDYSGDAQLIDATDIVSITAPSESEVSDPNHISSYAPVKPENEFDRIPSGIMDSIDIGNPEPILAEASVPNSNSDSGSTDYDSTDDIEIDVLVAGSCLGKKKAGVVWYDKRRPNKQNKSVQCKNGKFETKIKVNKKDVDFIDIQTLFYN